jgi:DNA-binding NarL/FixJ family response regulator
MAGIRPDPVRVLIADDHLLVLEATRCVLQRHRDILVVGEATDGIKAVEHALSLKPDVVLIDIHMPGLNGIEAARQINQRLPSTAVLILTALDDDDYVRAGFRAGASGYLLKTIGGEDLVDSVRRVSRGETVLHPSITAKLLGMIRQETPRIGQRTTARSRAGSAVAVCATTSREKR